MAISYGGISLPLEDPGGVTQAFLDQFQPIEDMCDQAASPSLVSPRKNSRSGFRSGCGLPRPNYPPPPRPKINSLYWPTGATRWARGYFLATTSIVEELVQQAQSTAGYKALELVLEDSGQNQVKLQMYMLPPRRIVGWPEPTLSPVSALGPGSQGTSSSQFERPEGLFILPLVDERYYWQYADSGELDTHDTWAELFSRLKAKLGLPFFPAPTVDPDYLIPDPDEFRRDYENAALLLEAACHSTGLRLVKQLDQQGSFEAINWADSEIKLKQNLGQAVLPLAGGVHHYNDGRFPEEIQITFPKYYQGAVHPQLHTMNPATGLHVETRQASNYVGTSQNPTFPIHPKADTLKTIHSTAYANFSTKSAQPDNNSGVIDLAEIIARDFYDSIKHQYDLTYPGLIPWEPTGYDDHLEFSFARLEDGRYQAHTRIQSCPANFGVEEQLQQFEDLPVYPSPAGFELNGSLVENGDAPAKFLKWAGSSYAAQTEIFLLKVHDAHGIFSGAAGDRGEIAFKAGALRWEIFQMVCPPEE